MGSETLDAPEFVTVKFPRCSHPCSTTPVWRDQAAERLLCTETGPESSKYQFLCQRDFICEIFVQPIQWKKELCTTDRGGCGFLSKGRYAQKSSVLGHTIPGSELLVHGICRQSFIFKLRRLNHHNPFGGCRSLPALRLQFSGGKFSSWKYVLYGKEGDSKEIPLTQEKGERPCPGPI